MHGTTGERPIDRFERAERSALKPLRSTPAFLSVRELFQVVHSDGCVEVDTHHYSVPWQLAERRVVVHILDGRATIFHGREQVACHDARPPSRARVVDPTHLQGLVRRASDPPLTSALQRPLREYEDLIGGAL